jgi:hypothetical protein
MLESTKNEMSKIEKKIYEPNPSHPLETFEKRTIEENPIPFPNFLINRNMAYQPYTYQPPMIDFQYYS